jgi:hypothetical protein
MRLRENREGQIDDYKGVGNPMSNANITTFKTRRDFFMGF